MNIFSLKRFILFPACIILAFSLYLASGSWFFPRRNETVDEVNAHGNDATDCRIDRQAIVGGNSITRMESIKECQDLLKRIFQLD